MARSISIGFGSPTPASRNVDRLARLLVAAAMLQAPSALLAAGTPAGTLIETTAAVDYDVNGVRRTASSDPVGVVVDEIIDVAVVALTPEVVAAPGESGRGALFGISNTGNGTETFVLAIDYALPGDEFDPAPATPAIFFDTDASGDLTPADEAYVPGSNDPILPADASVAVLVLSDLPSGLGDSQRGLTELTVSSRSATGAPGSVFSGAGDNGVDALVGASGGEASAQAEYVISSVTLSVTKSVSVADPFGGTDPVSGAVLTYSVDVQVTDGGTAANSTFSDPIPDNTTFVPASIAMNGNALTDAVDTDAGEYVESDTPAIVVRFGDLTQADGAQTVSFQVSID